VTAERVMKRVEIYTTPICGYCTAAKRLLTQKGVSFVEIDVMRDPGKRDEMTRRSNGGRTVPQIFIDGTPVGGCDDLYALERAGRLDGMLA
jgi:glutaredoxin 3